MMIGGSGEKFGELHVHVHPCAMILQTCMYITLRRDAYQSARRGQISYSCGSESRTRKLIYTMGILYGRISTWLTEQAVNSSRRYVSATSVRRVLSQALVEITIL